MSGEMTIGTADVATIFRARHEAFGALPMMTDYCAEPVSDGLRRPESSRAATFLLVSVPLGLLRICHDSLAGGIGTVGISLHMGATRVSIVPTTERREQHVHAFPQPCSGPGHRTACKLCYPGQPASLDPANSVVCGTNRYAAIISLSSQSNGPPRRSNCAQSQLHSPQTNLIAHSR